MKLTEAIEALEEIEAARSPAAVTIAETELRKGVYDYSARVYYDETES